METAIPIVILVGLVAFMLRDYLWPVVRLFHRPAPQLRYMAPASRLKVGGARRPPRLRRPLPAETRCDIL